MTINTTLLFVFLVISLTAPGTEAVQVRNRVNPIRRVVTLLQGMAKKVAEEGATEKALYEHFDCYCKTTSADLKKSVEDGTTRITETTSSIEAGQGALVQLKAQIKEAQDSRADAKEAMATGDALDEKAAAAFSAESAELTANIDALAKAIVALEKGVAGGAFLQASFGAIRKAAMSSEKVTDANRAMVLSFLSGSAIDGYAPQSGEIVGILKQLKDEMSSDLAAAEKEEAARKADHEGLVAAKKKEIVALTAGIEAKMQRQGTLAVEVESMKGDLTETKRTLAADQDLAAKLAGSCSMQASEWEERQKNRAEELVAIHETIKFLNDDDSLEMFKKVLPSPTLVQVHSSQKVLARAARAKLSPFLAHDASSSLNLISMALSGQTVDFSKVLSMIDEMVSLLMEEQTDDDSKKSYCVESIDKTEDEEKALEIDITGHKDTIAESEDQLAATDARIAAVKQSIVELDNSVAKATEIRQNQHADFVTVTADNAAASQLLGIAINRLNKFYAPSLFKAAPKFELSAEDRVYVSMGGEITTAAPTGIAGTVVSRVLLLQTQEPVAEPFTSKLEKKSEEYTGVVTLIKNLIADLDKDSQEANVEEKHAQKQYEDFMAESAANRAEKVKEIGELDDTRAAVQASLTKTKEQLRSAEADAAETANVLVSLHGSCDWLLQNFDVRKTARVGEVEALKNAKAVLAGADYSL